MTNTHPRQPLRPAAYRGLSIDRIEHRVIDEFAALRLHRPSSADYAAFVRNPPSIAAIVDRARHHANQVARFVALTDDSPEGVRLQLAQLYALTILNAIATVAAALLPAGTGADRHARRQQGAAFIQSLEDPADNELRDVAVIAFGLDDNDAVRVTSDAIAHASADWKAVARAGSATTHILEERSGLGEWLRRTRDVAALLSEVRRHGDAANRFAIVLAEDELSPRERDEMMAAQEGALLQHLVSLADLALSRAEVDTDLLLGAAHPSVMERAQMNATLLIAIAVGQHHRTMIAAHPY
ncbi:hypothetical protein [Bosea sp. (in: a-proteobacteria)]|jgi:methyl coenzyme M reductase subunit C|uniref:hypothetical protein n=1 Tax=Bosea sp. (in: a-proteobacteria) TaxID=1871050 RepID=UPI002DDD07B0|nr:hypothetical protein [Bosea sp. (in: a-proteobacteria)]HEV2510370.1 hypothetical protein [Bosea sp. (in: a-proteobacteria)]